LTNRIHGGRAQREGNADEPWSNDERPNHTWDYLDAGAPKEVFGVIGVRARQCERVGKHAQNSDDLLAIAPAHLTHELDASDQIHRTARPEEQAVALY